MGIVKGGFKRLLQSFLYLLAFCCAGIILGIYSYFLSVLANRNLPISKAKKAVEGIAGIAVVYTIFATLLTCCFGGIPFLAFIAIVIDVLMVGGFIALAVLTRTGSHSCSGNVNTPLGNGPASNQGSGYGSNGFGFGSGETATYFPKLGLACRLNKACFAVAIIGAFLFLITALMQIALVRHHKKEKRYGPSPANNYTSGAGKSNKSRRGIFGRKNKNNVEKDAELGAVGAGVPAAAVAGKHHHDNRASHDTSYTGSTAAPTGTGNGLVNDSDPTHYNTQVNSGHHLGTTAATGVGAGAVGAGAAHHHNLHHGNNASTGAPVQDQGVTGNNGTYWDYHTGHAPHGSHGGYYTQPQGTGANPYGYENNVPATGTVRDF